MRGVGRRDCGCSGMGGPSSRERQPWQGGHPAPIRACTRAHDCCCGFGHNFKACCHGCFGVCKAIKISEEAGGRPLIFWCGTLCGGFCFWPDIVIFFSFFPLSLLPFPLPFPSLLFPPESKSEATSGGDFCFLGRDSTIQPFRPITRPPSSLATVTSSVLSAWRSNLTAENPSMFTSGKHSDHTVKLRNGRELRVHKAIVCKACARLWLTLSTHRNRIPASRRPPIVPFELGLVNVLSSLPFRFSGWMLKRRS